MTQMREFLKPGHPAGRLPAGERINCARSISRLSDIEIYPRSVSTADSKIFALGRSKGAKILNLLSHKDDFGDFHGTAEAVQVEGSDFFLMRCDLTPQNAAALRRRLPFLNPRTLGLNRSAGCGDRLGLATPGHIRAARAVAASSGPGIAMILAQQSMRENERTGRSPRSVIDDAMWGVMQEGWDRGYGADADHLKTLDDVDLCVDAGYTFFTIDPGEHVDDAADHATMEELQAKSQAIPWSRLETSLSDLKQRLAAHPIDLGSRQLNISEAEITRAAVKYGKALAHTVQMYRHLLSRCEAVNSPFELEMSVDETATMTTTAEHIYIAAELKRLEVKWVSLAPRYFGRFEKGVDYLGEPPLGLTESLQRFRETFSEHVAVAKTFGPYKLSLHSGSDKFSVYPIVSELAGELVHLKTAGTSYLEALRTIAVVEPEFFREIVQCARERYPEDRASYHVSAELEKMPSITSIPEDELPGLLEDFHAREVLHVTFGSIVSNPDLHRRLTEILQSHEEGHYGALERHFVRHLKPFCQ